jgi:hypothetical protein
MEITHDTLLRHMFAVTPMCTILQSGSAARIGCQNWLAYSSARATQPSESGNIMPLSHELISSVPWFADGKESLTETSIHRFYENTTNVVHNRRDSTHVQASASHRIMRHSALSWLSARHRDQDRHDTYTCVSLTDWSLS